MKVTSYFHLQEKKPTIWRYTARGGLFIRRNQMGFFCSCTTKTPTDTANQWAFPWPIIVSWKAKQPLAVNIYVFFSWPRDFWTTHGSRTSQHRQHSRPAGAWAGAGTSALKNHHSDKIFGVACCLLNIFQIQISSGKWRKICLTKKAVSSAGWPKKKRRKNQRSFSDASISIETEIWGSKT